VNLTELDCADCPNLTSIPDTLVNLTELDCADCPKLTSIPDTLVNLTGLYCVSCPKLTSIPDTLVNLTRLGCWDCSWLNLQNPVFKENVKKFKENYDSLLSTQLISPFLTRKIVKFLIPIEI